MATTIEPLTDGDSRIRSISDKVNELVIAVNQLTSELDGKAHVDFDEGEK